MELIIKKTGNTAIAEPASQESIILTVDDAVDLMGNANYLGASAIVLYEGNLTPSFFDLSTRIAGEILQKFSNYRMRLAIVGDFDKYSSKSLRDFIRESNRSKHILFVSSLSEAYEKLG